MSHWIGEKEIPDKSRLFPIRALLNAIRDEDFVATIRGFVHREGAATEKVVCSFPHDLDSGEESFEGVEVSIHGDDKVIVRESTLLMYIRLASAAYVRLHPTDKDTMGKILECSELI